MGFLKNKTHLLTTNSMDLDTKKFFFCKYTYGMHGLNEREIWMVTLNQRKKLRRVRNTVLPKDDKDFVPWE